MSTNSEPDQKNSTPTPFEPAPKARSGRRLQFDEHGHAIPLTDAEREEDLQAFLVARAEMAAIPDDPAESDEEFLRAIDAWHPEHPLFPDDHEP